MESELYKNFRPNQSVQMKIPQTKRPSHEDKQGDNDGANQEEKERGNGEEREGAVKKNREKGNGEEDKEEGNQENRGRGNGEKNEGNNREGGEGTNGFLCPPKDDNESFKSFNIDEEMENDESKLNERIQKGIKMNVNEMVKQLREKNDKEGKK